MNLLKTKKDTIHISKKKLSKAIEKAEARGMAEGKMLGKKQAFEEGDSFKNGSVSEVKTILEALPQNSSVIEEIRDAHLESDLEKRVEKAVSKKKLKEKISQVFEAVVTGVTAVLQGISFDENRLNRIQKRCAKMMREDVLIRSLVYLVRRYTIGRGITFSTGSDEVNSYLELIWGRQGVNFEDRQKEIALHAWPLGEYFLVYFIEEGTIDIGSQKIPNISVRKFYPWEVKGFVVDKDDDENIFGIKRETPNKKTLVYPLVSYYLDNKNPTDDIDESDGEIAPNAFVQLIRLSDGFGYRGFPQIYPVLRWATIIRELMYDISSKFHEWSKVLFTLTVNDPAKDFKTDSGRTAPKGGTILVNSKNAQWDVLESKLDAQGTEKVFQTLMYYFSGGSGVPYQILIHDYSNSNYSSSREARTPMNKLIGDYQDYLGEEFKIAIRTLLKAGTNSNCLKSSVKVPLILEGVKSSATTQIYKIICSSLNKEKRIQAIREILDDNTEYSNVDVETLSISVDFPKVDTDSELNQAKVLKIYNELGADSKTLLERAGFDWNLIVANKLATLEADHELRDKIIALGQQGEEVIPDEFAGIDPNESSTSSNEENENETDDIDGEEEDKE